MDPYADRRGSERRHDGGWSTLLKVLGSPVSVLVLLGSIVLGTITVVQRADNAVQKDEYDYDRKVDAMLLHQSLDSLQRAIGEVNYRIIDLGDAQKAERARTDTVIRIMRRSVCRQQPDACP